MKSKYHILELCESYGGGVKRQVDYLNEYVDRSLFSLTTLVSSKRGSKVPESYLLEDRMSSFPKNLYVFFKSIKTVHKLTKKNNISLIHAHSTIAGIVAIMHKIVYFSKVPIVYTPHAYYSEIDRGKFKTFFLIQMEKIMGLFFSKSIHVSKEEARYATENGIVTQGESVIVNNGVPKRGDVKVDINSNRISFVNVARCDFQKNPELFINIAEVIAKYIPNTEFIWVGDGPLLEECIEKVKNMKLDNVIHFVGYSKNPYEYLESSNVFLSTSRYEGQPFSVIEAMSVGLPLIITDVIGHKELVNGNGKLISYRDILEESRLIDIFENVISNLNEEATQSYSIFDQKYKVEKMVNGIELVYEEVI